MAICCFCDKTVKGKDVWMLRLEKPGSKNFGISYCHISCYKEAIHPTSRSVRNYLNRHVKRESGQEVNDKDRTEFAKRVRKLSPKQIDKLWYLCGFIISGRGKKYKAIRREDIKNIKSSLNSAKYVVSCILNETSRKEFEKNLLKVEKRKLKKRG